MTVSLLSVLNGTPMNSRRHRRSLAQTPVEASSTTEPKMERIGKISYRRRDFLFLKFVILRWDNVRTALFSSK